MRQRAFATDRVDGTRAISSDQLSGRSLRTALIDAAENGGLGAFTTIATGGTRGDYTGWAIRAWQTKE
jgi:hypothetical protein